MNVNYSISIGLDGMFHLKNLGRVVAACTSEEAVRAAYRLLASEEIVYHPEIHGVCTTCRGFGYTKGSPGCPWDKVDCGKCNGKGTVKLV